MSHIGEDPFATPGEQRDPVRRLRGLLAAPVTLWTTTSRSGRHAGLTVSSVLVVEGEPPALLGLVGPLTDFRDAVEQSGRFVVHVLGAEQRRAAEIFAGRFPTPDPFAEVDAEPGPFGPVVPGMAPRVSCEVLDCRDLGYSTLVTGGITRIELDRARRPLLHYRGGYGTIAPR